MCQAGSLRSGQFMRKRTNHQPLSSAGAGTGRGRASAGGLVTVAQPAIQRAATKDMAQRVKIFPIHLIRIRAAFRAMFIRG